ncbi:hypothetical protein VNO77_18094 [Canavalia gladiata]|uniref:histidine kinase n=1 Tax=Canavalia gladiata TaxID=3824 RepID=A0AAN9LK65_CANGL
MLCDRHNHKSMGLYSSMIWRPSSLVILLVYAALLVLISLTPCWYVMVTQIERRVNLNSEHVLSQFQSEIEHSARLIHPINSSSTYFARFLSSILKATTISFCDIKDKVAPLLFQAFETVPHLAQVSYKGMEGLFFSYYTDNDQTLAMYSNSTSKANIYYIQPVNRDTGELYGEAIVYEPCINASWFDKNSYGNVSLGTKWNNDHDLLFITSATITGTDGVISLGFPATTITDFFTRVGASLYLATKDGKVLAEGIKDARVIISNDTVLFQPVNANGDQTSYDGTVSCKIGEEDSASVLTILDTDYLSRCSTIDIMGIESVYVLSVPRNGFVGFVHDIRKKGLRLLIVMIVMILMAMVSFVYINGRSLRREMHLCGSLIKQMEATQQAEGKSMNKSLAFASASHDVRASLAALTGLIEMSYHEVDPRSELHTNLKQMDSCTKDLLGLLNSILDTSKIEAGKMQLEEKEFDLFQLLEDVVDLYHPVAMKKGVDIVLDLCDGSLLRYSRTKGDRGKLKQVLCNLLSNAVKFTNEGHIAVRAWARKPSLQGSIIATDRYGFKRIMSCLFYKKNNDPGAINSIQQDPSCMDFTFEVDDTGIGIPKEKYESVFENYVQIKESGVGQGGTGLGLGIVQSLVRLMHGDIRIMEKDIGEEGTCFRFNVVLPVCKTETNGDRNEAQGVTILTTRLGGSSFMSSPGTPVSQVVLLIHDEERRRSSHRFMKSLGIKVKVVKDWRHLCYALEKIKQKGFHSHSPSSPQSSTDSLFASLSRGRGVSLSVVDGNDYVNSIFKKTDIEAASRGFVLIVIDANAGPFSELCRVVSDFKRGLSNPCRVVWLEKPLMPGVDFKILDGDVSSSNDIVLSKPFHGTRLFQVLRILPEYGGVWQCSSGRAKKGSIQSVGRSKYASSNGCKETPPSFGGQCYDRSKAGTVQGIQECGECSNVNDKPLGGMQLLVVEDLVLLRRITRFTLERLGALIKECENGEQAVRLVEEGLAMNSSKTPYDYILMDCQMPVMGGYEATKRIREIEKSYGVRIPIFALTANTGDEAKMSIEAGMDDHLVKPINEEALFEAIKNVRTKH